MALCSELRTEQNWADLKGLMKVLSLENDLVRLKELNLAQLTGKVMVHPLDSKMDRPNVAQKGILKKQVMAVSSDKQMVQNLD